MIDDATNAPEGCRVRIQLSETNNHAHLQIEFERFVEGTYFSGHGLRMAIVQALVRAPGGEVGILDRTGGGIAILVPLPLASREIHHMF